MIHTPIPLYFLLSLGNQTAKVSKTTCPYPASPRFKDQPQHKKPQKIKTQSTQKIKKNSQKPIKKKKSGFKVLPKN
jgi:hypothetical protein